MIKSIIDFINNIKLCKGGATRLVVLIGDYAFKFPTILYSPEYFIKGLLYNIKEGYIYSATKSSKLANIYYSNSFGLLNIMQRVIPLTEKDFFKLMDNNYQNYVTLKTKWGEIETFVEPKIDSFGYVKLKYTSEIVACDYH